MPAPRLPQLDQAVETVVFRALVDVLQADPVLQDVVNVWEVLDGTSMELDPPDTREMPWVCLMGGPSQLDIAEAGAWGMKYVLHVAIATAGLHQDDQTNLWGAFRKALNYQKPFRDRTVFQFMRDAGCTVYKITSPGLGVRTAGPEKGSRADDLYSTAQVILELTIPNVN